MGCNAWNHPPGCDCGWGGDTGGGWGGSTTGYASLPRLADGSLWSRSDKPSYPSYTDPNATCPVCKSPVFFYQSPWGGRVFFDQLGPPWTKHPCTDQGASVYARPPKAEALHKMPRQFAPYVYKSPREWRPLLSPDDIIEVAGHHRFSFFESEEAPGQYFYIPVGWWSRGPVFWRWSSDQLGMMEISSIEPASGKGIKPRHDMVAGWLQSDEEFRAWLKRPKARPDADTLNQIGLAFSFVHDIRHVENRFAIDDNDPLSDFPYSDFEMARRLFEESAAQGFWAALSNLGVIWRDGLGVDPNPEKAFLYFQEAAQSLEQRPLEHLARGYREGIGCAPDADMAAFLEEFIATLQDPEGDQSHDAD